MNCILQAGSGTLMMGALKGYLKERRKKVEKMVEWCRKGQIMQM